MRFKIKYVKDKIQPGNYVGMNSFAYKEIYNKRYPYPKHIILIYAGMSLTERQRTIRHEKIEIALMKKGKTYAEAHKICNELEDYKNLNIHV